MKIKMVKWLAAFCLLAQFGYGAAVRELDLTFDIQANNNLRVNHKASTGLKIDGTVSNSQDSALIDISGSTVTCGFKLSDGLTSTSFFAFATGSLVNSGTGGQFTVTLPASQWVTNITSKILLYGDVRISGLGNTLPSIDLWLNPSANTGSETTYIAPTSATFLTNAVAIDENATRIDFSTGITAEYDGTNTLTLTVDGGSGETNVIDEITAGDGTTVTTNGTERTVAVDSTVLRTTGDQSKSGTLTLGSSFRTNTGDFAASEHVTEEHLLETLAEAQGMTFYGDTNLNPIISGTVLLNEVNPAAEQITVFSVTNGTNELVTFAYTNAIEDGLLDGNYQGNAYAFKGGNADAQFYFTINSQSTTDTVVLATSDFSGLIEKNNLKNYSAVAALSPAYATSETNRYLSLTLYAVSDGSQDITFYTGDGFPARLVTPSITFGSAGVNSFNGRQGTVVTESGDYDAFYITQTGSVTLAQSTPDLTGNIYSIAADEYTVIIDDDDAQVTDTLFASVPNASANSNRVITIKKIGTSHNVVAARSNSDLLDGAQGITLSNQWQFVTLQSDGVSSWYRVASGIDTDLSTYMQNLSDDTTPTLGGNLDGNDQEIIGVKQMTVTNPATSTVDLHDFFFGGVNFTLEGFVLEASTTGMLFRANSDLPVFIWYNNSNFAHQKDLIMQTDNAKQGKQSASDVDEVNATSYIDWGDGTVITMYGPFTADGLTAVNGAVVTNVAALATNSPSADQVLKYTSGENYRWEDESGGGWPSAVICSMTITGAMENLTTGQKTLIPLDYEQLDTDTLGDIANNRINLEAVGYWDVSAQLYTLDWDATDKGKRMLGYIDHYDASTDTTNSYLFGGNGGDFQTRQGLASSDVIPIYTDTTNDTLKLYIAVSTPTANSVDINPSKPDAAIPTITTRLTAKKTGE